MPTLGASVGVGTGAGEGDGEGTGEGTKGAGVGVGVVVVSTVVATTSTPIIVLICDVNAAGDGGATAVKQALHSTPVITLTAFVGDICTVMGTTLPILAKVSCNAVAFAAELAISSTFEASPVLMIALT